MLLIRHTAFRSFSDRHQVVVSKPLHFSHSDFETSQTQTLDVFIVKGTKSTTTMKQFNARCLKCNFSPTKANAQVKHHTSVLKTCTRLLGTALTILIRPHYKTDPVPFFLIYCFGSSIQTEGSSAFQSGNRRGKKNIFLQLLQSKRKVRTCHQNHSARKPICNAHSRIFYL